MSITIPDKLELDAFELDIPEDAVGDHIAAPEEITLKGIGIISLFFYFIVSLMLFYCLSNML
uniref:Uncharacterized protein n=1 Tax=Cajanus cajan TaxID=3821 RepID=A0A151RJ29_CAJCA|nr:hypothetical protein KK1_035999 [Cajanus cajan]